jgi:hypothetical protein
MRPLVPVLCACFALFAGQSQTARSEGENAKKTSQIPDKGKCKSPCGPTTIIEKKIRYSEGRQSEEKKKAEQRTTPVHDRIDYINACSTAVIAFFTILLFGGLIWQILTSRTIERAWVMADVESDSEKWRDRKLHMLQGSGTSGDSTAIYAVLVCTNAGKSPAWLDEMRARFEIVETLPPIPNFESAEHIETGIVPLGMMEGGAVPYVQRLSWTAIATGHEELGKMAVIYGFVRYRDIFQKRRVTTFAYRVINGQLRRLENYAKYNENT